jgi:uncharacterized membrane protein YdjX (TVP38/TMEM64 family)
MPPETPPRFRFCHVIWLAVSAAGGAIFFAAGGARHFNFAAFVAHRTWLLGLAAENPLLAPMAFIAAYAGLTALSFPAAELLTLSGGFLFGRWLGTAYAVIGATIGATIVFQAARAGLAGIVMRAGPAARRLTAGFRRNALSYLLVLRLVPLFPFWLMNLAAGATDLPPRTYVVGTFVGVIPAAFIYASLGEGIGAVITEGQQPDFGLLLRAPVLLPLLGLAVLALLPIVHQRWRNTVASE